MCSQSRPSLRRWRPGRAWHASLDCSSSRSATAPRGPPSSLWGKRCTACCPSCPGTGRLSTYHRCPAAPPTGTTRLDNPDTRSVLVLLQTSLRGRRGKTSGPLRFGIAPSRTRRSRLHWTPSAYSPQGMRRSQPGQPGRCMCQDCRQRSWYCLLAAAMSQEGNRCRPMPIH